LLIPCQSPNIFSLLLSMISGSSMKIKNLIFAALLFPCAFIASAEENDTSQLPKVYIADDLFIYMHAGPGTNYRILGSITAGEEVSATGQERNGYTEIIDNKNRTTWVETKFVQQKPGMRFIIAELNTQVATEQEQQQSVQQELTDTQNQVSNLQAELTQVQNLLKAKETELADVSSKLKTQDREIMKEYFLWGAIVLSIGLLFGLILPRLAVRKRSSMESWR